MTSLARRSGATALCLVLLAACVTADRTPSPTAARPSLSPAPSPAGGASATTGAPSQPAGGVPECEYEPGDPVAEMPAEVTDPPPSEAPTALEPPPQAPVDAATTARHLEIFEAAWETVRAEYVDPDLNGVDWNEIGERYRALVQRGVADYDLEWLLNLMLGELGDEHSAVESPETRADAEEQLEGDFEYVGIGVLVDPVPETEAATVILTMPDGPAAAGGVEPHDSIVAVEGEPVLDPSGFVRPDALLGFPGTSVTITVRSPDGDERDVTLERAEISGSLPVTACVVADAAIGYVMLPCLCDETIPGQVEDALRAMAAGHDLEGLVIDNRANYGGYDTVLTEILSLFVDGEMGSFRTRDEGRPLVIEGRDVAGSSDLPLAVLVGPGTNSFGEVLSGLLQSVDGATLVGDSSLGNVEVLTAYELPHGWRAWIAHETFDPIHSDYGPWEDTGIRPDVRAPARWDLFDEGNDPGLAAAVEALADGGAAGVREGTAP